MPENDEWDAALVTDADANGAAAKPKDEPPEPVYPNVEEWVTDFLAPSIRRPRNNSQCWCACWWAHAEALSRLEALWRAWEFLRLDGTTGMSVWWRDHADPHLGFLFDRDRSPFSNCRDDLCTENPELVVKPAPAGYWGEE
jgi:hypothetical protein